jgi:serine/threonine protein kinase
MQIGDYEVVRELGRGGMGVVYEARPPQGEPHVAIKVLLDDGCSDDGEARFRREAQACARLRHPNLVAFQDFGVAQGRPYLVMEFLEGPTLQDLLARVGAYDHDDAARMVATLADALAVAHDEGVLHRDLKPENVILVGERPVLTDFGLARVGGGELERLTQTGEILGTPAFMAPEQADGDPRAIGVATDIYGLGATLYALLTGAPPFGGGGSILGLLSRVLDEPPLPPRSLVPAIPQSLEAICLRCLAKDPAERYPDMRSLAASLRTYEDPQVPRRSAPLAVAGALAVVGLGLAWVARSSLDPATSPVASPSASLSETPSSPTSPSPQAPSAMARIRQEVRSRRFDEAWRLCEELLPQPRRASLALLRAEVVHEISLRRDLTPREFGREILTTRRLQEAGGPSGDLSREGQIRMHALSSLWLLQREAPTTFEEDAQEVIRLGHGAPTPAVYLIKLESAYRKTRKPAVQRARQAKDLKAHMRAMEDYRARNLEALQALELEVAEEQRSAFVDYAIPIRWVFLSKSRVSGIALSFMDVVWEALRQRDPKAKRLASDFFDWARPSFEDFARAVRSVDSSIRRHPNDSRLYSSRGWVYKHWHIAFRNMQRLLAVAKRLKAKETVVELESVLERMRGPEALREGIASFSRAVDLDPRHGSAYLELAYLRGENNRSSPAKLQQAGREALRAVALRPRDPHLLDTAAIIVGWSGRGVEGALLKRLSKSFRNLQPTDPAWDPVEAHLEATLSGDLAADFRTGLKACLESLRRQRR